MKATAKATGIGYSLYVIASVLVSVGVVLSWSGSVRAGGSLLVVGVALGVSAAIQLGHLKRW
jgi:hypothetical protein